MSSNIRLTRICQHCEKEFIAKTTVTKYCGDNCAKRAYKVRKRNEGIQKSNIETVLIRSIPVEQIKLKEFLSVRETCLLLGASKPTVYRLINSGKLIAHKLTPKKTIVKRVDIDKLFHSPLL